MRHICFVALAKSLQMECHHSFLGPFILFLFEALKRQSIQSTILSDKTCNIFTLLPF